VRKSSVFAALLFTDRAQVAITVPELPNLPSAVVSGLRPNKDYAIRVRAHNAIGHSSWSP